MVLVILVALVVAAALGAGEEEADPSSTRAPAADRGTDDATSDERPEEEPPEPETPPADATLGVGDSDTTSGFEVTLLQVADPWQPTNEFERPSEGKRFVATELNLVNTRSEAQSFSTILGLEMIDSLGQRWNVAFAGFELPSLDGDVPAGTNIRGWAVYEVPADATGLQLVVKGSLTASGVRFHLD